MSLSIAWFSGRNEKKERPLMADEGGESLTTENSAISNKKGLEQLMGTQIGRGAISEARNFGEPEPELEPGLG